MSEGRKYDGEKPQLYLLPPKSITEVGKVLTFGAKKYRKFYIAYIIMMDGLTRIVKELFYGEMQEYRSIVYQVHSNLI